VARREYKARPLSPESFNLTFTRPYSHSPTHTFLHHSDQYSLYLIMPTSPSVSELLDDVTDTVGLSPYDVQISADEKVTCWSKTM
jgi:hypothetical protein